MTRLIKSDAFDGPRVRSLPVASAPTEEALRARAVDAQFDTLRNEIAALKIELEAKGAEIAELRGEVSAAFEAGQTTGREAGLKAAKSREAERLAALDAALKGATEDYRTKIEALEHIATSVAAAGLEKVFGARNEFAALATEVIKEQVRQLERRSIVSVEVSRADFTDDEKLEALAASARIPKLLLTASDDLPAGGCTIKLTLGALEIGVDQQWSRLRSMLIDASPEEPG
jgi:flagellar biosynthesis/type III secretory pathway protein FliH